MRRKMLIFFLAYISTTVIVLYKLQIQAMNVARKTVIVEKEFLSAEKGIYKKQRVKGSDVNVETKLVLLYTPIFGRMPWKGMKDTYDFIHWDDKLCPVSNCRISYNKSDLPQANAVIFHGRDMLTMTQMKQILPSRTPTQRWVYFMHENPHYTYYDPAIYNGLFNWTMTYRRDSDFFVPYNYYSRLKPEDMSNSERNYAEGKHKLVSWMVSHCGELRETVVRELLKYIQVDVYGPCGRKFNQSHHCDKASGNCWRIKNQYKFYLAFENKNCVDYVTEKYWYTLLESTAVPIVLGGSNYDSKVAIPGSFINILDFSSVQALAEYLDYLDRNDTAYNEYFRWRRHFKVKVSEPWTCQMCAKLNDPSSPVKVYNHLGKFWGINESCSTKGIKRLLRADTSANLTKRLK